jgi:uncharacterized protein YjbI with pentapeptide repeats
MADEKHLAQLREGAVSWNAWRQRNLSVLPDLHRADLSKAPLGGANLSRSNLYGASIIGADLREANISEATLIEANLTGANLSAAKVSGANLTRANLSVANFKGADLREANLREANLSGAIISDTLLDQANLLGMDLRWLSGADLGGANLSGANVSAANLMGTCLHEAILRGANLAMANLSWARLRGAFLNDANLERATLVESDFTGADLTGARIYGVSAWGVKLERTNQQNLIITPENEPEITVDNIEVAQFVYLLLNNEKIRDVIDTIGKKAVLILGRFTVERKVVLDALRNELRNRNLLPILFDFAIPASRDVTETIKTLVGLARFVIADVTDAAEVRVELHNIVRDFPSLPVQPILLRGHPKFVSQLHLEKFPWFLPTFEYEDPRDLLASLDVVADAETKVSAVEEALKEARRKIEAEMIRPR